ncbi:MAG: TlyA family RNA methyltransferase [Deltaproteobacteria bacterium]
MAKSRLDLIVQERGLASTREKARAMILAGEVQVNGKCIDKPGTNVDNGSEIELLHTGPRYVSRGGLKLEKAIRAFQVDFTSKTVLDVGASTGGYTDCALQHGAARVYAVDVGYGQLDWKLRNDDRVTNIERTNIRYFTLEDLGEPVDIVTIDVSFISTEKVFPVVKNLVRADGDLLVLIKPQFEAGKDKVGKKGVVKDPTVHREVLLKCMENAQQQGLGCVDCTFSPITGPQGNIEFFLHLIKNPAMNPDLPGKIADLVEQAHRELGGKKAIEDTAGE